MNIIEESFKEKEEKPKKRRRLVLIFLILIIVAIIITIGLMIATRKRPLTVIFDGSPKNEIIQSLKIEADGTIYVPIKKMAEYVGYRAFDGDSKTKSEETSKCYIENDNEIVDFTLNSKRVYSLQKADDDADYVYYDMKNAVQSIGGQLYVRSEEVENVFNAKFAYDQVRNRVTITTLQTLVQQYKEVAMSKGFAQIDPVFVNQKAIFKDMLVVTDEEEQIFGVIKASTGDTVIESKYASIEYLPTIGDFIVGDDEDKFGVVGANRENKVAVNYDSVELIDKDAGLYVVGKDGKFGVVDLKGSSKIPVEYDQIGINSDDFDENNIRNKFLLVDNLIPVQKNNLWGLFNKRGNPVLDLQYDSFGYIATSNKDAINLLVVPNYNVIVACKDKKYALINQTGQPLFKPVVDDIYMIYEGGKYKYIMNYNDQKIQVEDYLKQTGVNSANNNKGQQQQQQQQGQEQQNQEQQQQQGQEQQQQQGQEQQQLTEEQIQQQQQQQQMQEQQQQQQMQQQQQQQQQQVQQ